MKRDFVCTVRIKLSPLPLISPPLFLARFAFGCPPFYNRIFGYFWSTFMKKLHLSRVLLFFAEVVRRALSPHPSLAQNFAKGGGDLA